MKQLYRLRGSPKWFGRKLMDEKRVRVFRRTFPSLRLVRIKRKRR